MTSDEIAHEKMPPVGHRVSESEMRTLKSWIKQGAEWPPQVKVHVDPDLIPLE